RLSDLVAEMNQLTAEMNPSGKVPERQSSGIQHRPLLSDQIQLFACQLRGQGKRALPRSDFLAEVAAGEGQKLAGGTIEWLAGRFVDVDVEKTRQWVSLRFAVVIRRFVELSICG